MPERNIEDAPPVGSETWSWGNAEWWSGLFGAVATGAFLILPASQDTLAKGSLFYRVFFAALIFIVPYVLRFAWFFGKRLLLLFWKANWYDTVFGAFERQRTEKEQMQEVAMQLRQQLYANRQFEIGSVRFYNDQIYITLVKSKGATKLSSGDRLSVLGTEDGALMGNFEVKEDKPKEYLAIEVNSMAPIWEGLVREAAKAGNFETLPPPLCVALFLVKSESEGNND